MENNNIYGTPQSNDGQALGIASITLGVMSLFTLCVPWLMLIIAAGGLVCGIISWQKTRQSGKPLTLPIIGYIVSGVAVIVAAVIVVTLHITMNRLDQKYQEMDSIYSNMRDSLMQWDTQLDYENLPEPDSTFFIDN